ncbi:GntR family transcriptional regulator [Paenarthrobacter sp. DKR-5]|uniref:GntR family transcriptional regulator n=1 Tax=Paenarthrobacter sp. DKR-5 TaxID=2835535 RepID=UPI001BDBB915|nr:GntR family transcriptional regulator [Paenarthrobacter sp. DKR-5]MBT1001874.1 GntR family transcriptional regulator [Paenarthrobacter sp. DKR-5]
MSELPAALRDWSIQQNGPVPPFEQIRRRIADGAGSGSLAVGTKLPPVRALASRLGVAVNTVARAYRELEMAGIVQTLGRGGTVVASSGEARDQIVAEAAATFADVVRSQGMDAAQALSIAEAALRNADR